MADARTLMSTDVQSILAEETIDRAAQVMRDHNVGALPVKSADGALLGIVTDRDLVVRALAAGKTPDRTTLEDLVEDTPVAVTPDAHSTEVLQAMGNAQVRRVVVVEDGDLLGIISEADLAQHLADEDLAAFVRRVYQG
ncbi:CBS domain-containing protein [Streptomyces albidoflavus]|jgi:CBS domain-containing protein|uniref:CBS domain-containing protein n=2 Tax=Streptomyces TaxID=1883 RepID=D6B525_9ACTN|nr:MULTISPECIES: CBS domain-containing protein [Streptomyces]MYQ75006.1 CBS domain-containing protein [Streptomyces sp. SID4934]MYX53771.1 CBS domain-containing protein [Streptomyces sp. SID8385]MYX87067.1 CBS domain-containing protein [Streptomyces sp. SID4915]SCE42135.1 CBS domain-containing protein [Streptomyces sp. IgraMP-1]BDH52889.1 hypoxic response protein 1 [Streptomyces albus]